jgi:hypothetical protein
MTESLHLMPLQPIPKPYAESNTPRPEKRHYIDYLALYTYANCRDLESKLLSTDPNPKTTSTTYREEYAVNEGKLADGKFLSRVVRRNRRIWDIYSAPMAELQVFFC